MLSMSKFNSKTSKLALSLIFVATLAACGGSDDYVAPAAVVKTNAVFDTKLISPAVAATAFVAATPTPIAFPDGFAGVDAAGSPVIAPNNTAIDFSTGTATKPTATFTAEGKTVDAITTFGSCLFTFAANSPFAATHPFGPGKTFKVDPCAITIPTANATANGVEQNLTLSVTFGTTTVTKIMPIVVSTTGAVSIGGVTVATVDVVANTGGTN